MPTKSRNNCKCLKCSFEWFSAMLFFDGQIPKTCPKCHNYDWMTPRIRKRRKVK